MPAHSPDRSLPASLPPPPYGQSYDVKPERVQEGGVRNAVSTAYVVDRSSPGAQANIARNDISKPVYWEDMEKVYRLCLHHLRPGGVMAVVVKDFVRNKQIVPVCQQTLDLLVRVGFTPLEWTRAMQTADPALPESYNERGELKTIKTFFRRDLERKGVIPAIDEEAILWVCKPTATAPT